MENHKITSNFGHLILGGVIYILLQLVCSSVGSFVTLGRVEMSGRVSGKQRESKETKTQITDVDFLESF